MTTQIRNAAMVSLLEPDFLRRNEPSPKLGDIISNYLALPGLRGFWPFSSVDENGDAYDLSGQGRVLTNTNSVTFNNTDFLPYAEFNGSSNYLTRADEAGLDITGDLTLGAWVNLDALAVAYAIIGKRVTTLGSTSSSYGLDISSGNILTFSVANSTTGYQATLDFATYASAGDWVFLAGRFTPSTSVKMWLNATTNTNTTSIPATINNSSSAFRIGANASTAQYLNGNLCLAFLCAYALPDNMITNLYQQSRVLFGV